MIEFIFTWTAYWFNFIMKQTHEDDKDTTIVNDTPKTQISSTKLDILRGTLDTDNPLNKVRGNALVLDTIFQKVEDDFMISHIDKDSIAYYSFLNDAKKYMKGSIVFPEPKNRNINMLPFKIWDKSTWTDDIRAYIDIIYNCPCRCIADKDKVFYLTVQESFVRVGETQRRAGLHVESPAGIIKGGRIIEYSENDEEYNGIAWGMGNWDRECKYPVDGIYIASNISDSCKVWPVLIDKPNEVSDKFGGIEKMREHLGAGYSLKANELCWITDATPHESLPMKTPVYRQFFRLVTGDISVWYNKHNTANPNCSLPPNVLVCDDDKFK